MSSPATVCLPIEDRRRSHRFYCHGLGLDAVGPLADDGLPEPLQHVVNNGLAVMLIPRGGFGWVVTGREVAAGPVECLLSLTLPSVHDVDAFAERAAGAGGRVVAAPQLQPWGEYSATVADPDGHLWQLTTPVQGE